MIERVVITDNKRSPLRYLPDLRAFRNGRVFEFKPGVNVIVGKNGCGKTTLMKLIERYLLVDKTECSKGLFNSNINSLFAGFAGEGFLGGIEVFADYEKNIFRLCHAAEKGNDDIMDTFDHFSELFTQRHSSTGEGVCVALEAMFKNMFKDGANLTFDYSKKVDELYKAYHEYVSAHRVKEHDEWTLLMDEPDRNLDIENMEHIKSILSFHKPQTQIIAVVHNPLLICALAKNPEVNMIEMTRGYISKIRKLVKACV